MSSSSSPCAACKFLRRKCTQECVFAPYFPPDKPLKFANVHRVFGASNVAKLLNELNPAQREDAVNSLAFEADARLRDPVNGCVGMISILQQKLKLLQIDLTNAKKELATYIGPQAMLPMLQPNNTAAAAAYMSQEAMGGGLNHSSYVVPYNMGPMMGIPTVGGGTIPQAAPQLGPPVQMFEAAKSAVVTVRPDQQDIYRAYHHHHQQQQEEVKFESRGLNGVVEAVPGSTGYNQMNGGGMSPSLALGIYDNAYHIQPQQQTEQELYTGNHQQHHLHGQLLLQPQHAQAADHPPLPHHHHQQQQQSQHHHHHHHQRSDSEERKSAALSC